ncbi:hypothetical protein Patl1_34451 [Pistacia atlantica]|uniref:Uncharacterized protein n=1 Tax=Pistacia atlantica TaxID=434234 RepID=A0ACC0ZRL2_9ROSI|nr:hypothetical protein Patl1_34451 [Pistacia atlantica]
MDNQRRIDLLWNICSLITGSIYSFICKGFEFLVKHQKPAVVLVLFMTEAISVALDQLGKSKSNCLLAALLLSAFTFLITVFPHIVKGGTSARKSKAERQLLVVEIVFSVVQLIASLAHYIMTLLGVKYNYNSLIFPLAFATIAVVFLFLKDEMVADSSHDQTDNISSRESSHSINIPSSTDFARSSDPNHDNQLVNFRSRSMQRNQSKNIVENLELGIDLQ